MPIKKSKEEMTCKNKKETESMIPKTPSARLEYFKNNKFKNEEILPYLIEHVEKYKEMNPTKKTGYQKYKENNHPILSPILGEIIFVLIEKIVKGPKFKGYSEDWQFDFRSNAYLLLCKYIHNFDAEKTTAMKYLYSAIENAMFQELNRHKEQSKRFAECSVDSFTPTSSTTNIYAVEPVSFLPSELRTYQEHELI